MKLQSMTIIFIIIILPITLILSSYIQKEIKVLNEQIACDTKLYNSTYDAVKAFQLNTVNNTESDIVNSKLRDINASVNTFFNSIGSNFGMSGYNSETIKDFVPALVFTMYDGYYIYSPYEKICNEQGITEQTAGGTKELISTETLSTEFGLKPYVYYSCRYVDDGTDSDFIITYSLENYIKIQGKINGDVVNDEGYVLDYTNIKVGGRNPGAPIKLEELNDTNKLTYRGVPIESEQLSEKVGDTIYKYAKINGTKYYLDEAEDKIFYIMNEKKSYLYGTAGDNKICEAYKNRILSNTSGQEYYVDGYNFTKRLIEEYDLGDLTVSQGKITGNNGEEELIDINGTTNNFEIFDEDQIDKIVEPTSNFNIHRLDVIKKVIETNLSTAIAGYNKYSNKTTNFQMPKLKETEWELLYNNVCAISFLQGINIGGKTYNGYSVIPNNKNKETVSENSIYIAETGSTNPSENNYYKVEDTELREKLNENGTEDIVGYFNLDFERASIKEDENTQYYLPQEQKGSYTSIVGKSGIDENWDGNVYEYLDELEQNDTNNKIKETYYTALGRERYGTISFKVNDPMKLETIPNPLEGEIFYDIHYMLDERKTEK